MVLKIKILLLKRKARKYFLRYQRVMDGMGCGQSLGNFISSEAAELKSKFNSVMDELKKLDPSCPSSRLMHEIATIEGVILKDPKETLMPTSRTKRG